MTLLLADKGPQLVHFQAADAKPHHDAVVQLGTATANPRAKAHDRITVDASQPLDRPDGHALCQAPDDLDLLVPRKEAHNAYLPYMGEHITYNIIVNRKISYMI